MASAISNALKRKKELERELAEIERFIALHDQFSGPRAAGGRRSPEVALGESDDNSTEIPGVASEGKPRGRPAEFIELMEAVIRQAGKPLSRSKLVEALEGQGVDVPSEDKPRYLGTILWRNRDRFINVSGVGYIMKDMVSPSQVESLRQYAERTGADADVAMADGPTPSQ